MKVLMIGNNIEMVYSAQYLDINFKIPNRSDSNCRIHGGEYVKYFNKNVQCKKNIVMGKQRKP